MLNLFQHLLLDVKHLGLLQYMPHDDVFCPVFGGSHQTQSMPSVILNYFRRNERSVLITQKIGGVYRKNRWCLWHLIYWLCITSYFQIIGMNNYMPDFILATLVSVSIFSKCRDAMPCVFTRF